MTDCDPAPRSSGFDTLPIGCALEAVSLPSDPFRQAFEHAGVGMVVMDLAGTLLHVNRSAAELFGHSPEELLGYRYDELKHPDEAALEADQFDKLATGELAKIQSERRYRHRLGHDVWIQATATLVRDEQGQPSYIVGTFQSIDDRRKAESELRALNSQLARLASFDGLTGLPNRRTLVTGFEQMWAASSDSREPLSCILFDIDHFKQVNDCHGHAAGDEVLRHVGNVLLKAVRPHDLCGRWGGEEFLVVCHNARGDEAYQIAETIRRLVALEPVTWRDLQIPVTVSLGVAQRTVLCHEPHELIALADEQLYAAKRMGRNCACIGAEGVDEDAEDSRQTTLFRPTKR
jgi:diguanylate cyclase (GGDEF)-like protein/PAS domain S-box-containing protein